MKVEKRGPWVFHTYIQALVCFAAGPPFKIILYYFLCVFGQSNRTNISTSGMISDSYKHITRIDPAQEQQTDGHVQDEVLLGCARGMDGFETDVGGNADARQ